MQKSKIIYNKPYMTKNLTEVSDTYLEPRQASIMEFFFKNS